MAGDRVDGDKFGKFLKIFAIVISIPLIIIIFGVSIFIINILYANIFTTWF